MAFSVDASVTLHDGTVVRHHVDGSDTENRATVERRAGEELGRLIRDDARYDGKECVDLGARIEFVTDDRSTTNPRDFVRSLPAANLVMNSGVRLFGSPPLGVGSNGNPAATGRLWVPIQNTSIDGATYTVYREANYLNAEGAEAGGRLVRVPHGSGDVQILVNGEWRRLYGYTGDGGDNPTPGGLVPDGDLRPVSDAALVAVPMSPAVPGGITETDDGRFFTYNLTPSIQETVGGRVYDVYTAPGPNGPTTWRRLHEGTSRPWEFRQADGSWTASPAICPPEVADVVRRTPPGWTISFAGDSTFFSENSGTSPRTVRINNGTGLTEIMTGPGTYRAATADDHLPAFVSFSPGPQTATVTDRGRGVSVSSLSGAHRFMTEGEGASAVRYEVMVPPGDPPPAAYRRRVDASGRPLADPGWQRFVPTTGSNGRWEDMAAARPATHPPAGHGTVARPSRSSGGDIL